MTGPWEKFAAPEAAAVASDGRQPSSGKPWERFQKPAPEIVFRGSILPVNKDAEGNVSFDINAGITGQILRAISLPYDAYSGKVDPLSDEGISRAFEFATVFGGTSPVTASGGHIVPGAAWSKTTPQAAGPSIVSHSVDKLRSAVAPFSRAGQEREASRRLFGATSNLDEVRVRLSDPTSDELIPGSVPTTGELTGDMGILTLERDAQTKRPDLYQQRRAERNAARRAALDSAEPDANVVDLPQFLRDQLQQIDERADAAMAEAAGQAAQADARLGEGMSPEAAGSTMRDRLQATRDTAKQEERRLWNAVDPDGTLAIATSRTRKFVKERLARLPKSAKPPADEEAAIYEIVRSQGDVVPFQELLELHSRVKDAMRHERMTAGESRTYARLSELNAALFADLEGAARGKAQAEAAEVAAGRLAPEETTLARLTSSDAPTVGSKVYLPSGRELDVDYAVVEADSLRTSHQPGGRPDPAYPAELQPRDRTRAASDAQITSMARGLQPERLGASTSAADGAPIIGPDGVVESGNGRVLGIRQAYSEGQGSAQAYKAYLARQGYDVSGFREPVLVRIRRSDLSPEERVRFTQEANAGTTLSLSASEQAASDASRLTPDMMDHFQGGDAGSADNRNFARHFVGKVAEKGQEGALVTAGGALSIDGLQRVRRALFHAAYDDAPLIAALAEEGDDNIKAFGAALSEIAGDVAKLRSRISAGDISPDMDISAPLVEASRLVQSSKSKRVKLSDMIAQADAFSPISEDAAKVLRIAYGRGYSGRISRERLTEAMRGIIAEAEKQTSDARLFGDAVNLGDILEVAENRALRKRSVEDDVGSAQTFPTVSDHGARDGGNGAAERGLGTVPDGQGRNGKNPAGGRGAGKSVLPADTAPPVALEPRFGTDDLNRLHAARDATRNRAEVHDNRLLKPMLRRSSTVGPYDMPAHSVAENVFTPGAAGFERIGAFRRAVNDDPAALEALERHAVESLRRSALDPKTGLLDAGRVSAWRAKHADALRAFPELAEKVADAGKASQLVDEVALAAKAEREAAQTGIAGKLLGLEDEQDIVRHVGQVLGSRNAVQQLKAMMERVGGHAEALEGLRLAMLRHISGKMVSNTEAATSGVTLLKSDGFQGFLKENRQALETVLEPRQMAVLEALAADLQRANRTLSAVRIPGQSNTAQDTRSILGSLKGMFSGNREMVGAGMGASFGFPVAAVGAMAAKLVGSLRQAGINSIEELVIDAVMNPNRARYLLTKLPTDPRQAARAMENLAQRYGLAFRASSVVARAAPAQHEERRN